ncbi:MAG: protein kinase [Planctomycetia bacterium]|nr:protein kinase [Planctomycetia bacterium]
MGKVSASCPTCGQRYSFNEADIGRTARCRKCGARFPAAAESAAPRQASVRPGPAADSGAAQGAESGPRAPIPAASGSSETVIYDRFKVIGILGEGGLGRVFLLQDIDSGQSFAVKRVLAPSAEARSALLRELQTWMNLPPHPNLVACRFVRSIGNEVTIFAEYVPGGTLADWIKKGRLYSGTAKDVLGRILDVAIQVACGLHVAHEAGTIHQDVKPANVLMSEEGLAKVADFGMALSGAQPAVRTTSPTPPQSSAEVSIVVSMAGGTPAYFSPEQAEALAQARQGLPPEQRTKLTRRTDLWSWALSVLEMILGERRWSLGQAAGRTLENYLDEGSSRDEVPEIPEELSNILRDCLKSNPRDRLGTLHDAAARCTSAYKSIVGTQYPRQSAELPPPAARNSKPFSRALATGGGWGDPRHWLQIARAAIEGRESASNGRPQVAPRSNEAQAASDLVVFDEAKELLESLLRAGRSEFAAELGQLCLGKAVLHQYLGDKAGAEACHERAIRIFEGIGNAVPYNMGRFLLARAYEGRANWHMSCGMNQSALELHDRALATLEQLAPLVTAEGENEFLEELANVHLNKGSTLRSMGNRPSGVGSFDNAIALYQEMNSKAESDEGDEGLADARMNKGITLMELGQNEAAERELGFAISAFDRLVFQRGHADLRAALAHACTNKGISLAARRSHVDALSEHDRAITLLEQLVKEGHGEQRNSLAAALLNKASVLGSMRDRSQAEFIRRALAIREDLVYKEGHHEFEPELALAYQASAAALATQGAVPEALGHFDKAIAIYSRQAGPEIHPELGLELARALTRKANLLDTVGRRGQAVESYDEAIGRLESLEKHSRVDVREDMAIVCTEKGIALKSMGQLAEAVRLYDRAIRLRTRLIHEDRRNDLRESLAMVSMNKANALREVGERVEALELASFATAEFARLVNDEGRHDLTDILERATNFCSDLRDSVGDPQSSSVGGEVGVRRLEDLVRREGRKDLEPQLAIELHNWAVQLASSGAIGNAIPRSDSALEILNRLVREEHREDLRHVLRMAQGLNAALHGRAPHLNS